MLQVILRSIRAKQSKQYPFMFISTFNYLWRKAALKAKVREGVTADLFNGKSTHVPFTC
jgi:hypothetical protein